VKYLVALMALMVFAVGPAALAEPICFDSDSAPVTLDIACWVYIHFVDEQASFDLEVEPGMGGDWEEEEFLAGWNCPAYLWAELIPPPGAPGVWDYWFPIPGWKDAYVWDPYEDALGWAGVSVSGITIYDPAGFYPGGAMNIYIACLY